MAKTVSISEKLQGRISDLESNVAALQQELEAAKQNLLNYNAHKQVIESILNLQTSNGPAKPKRKYTKRAKE
ncbi:MAG: hypothetical protein ABS46_02195 [Cytophagaceae bacterium SCN 52-12]|nr:MAG: hypothetical protein ABS46_02195 [Cytophagaceae bacterium SCN 52-12]